MFSSFAIRKDHLESYGGKKKKITDVLNNLINNRPKFIAVLFVMLHAINGFLWCLCHFYRNNKYVKKWRDFHRDSLSPCNTLLTSQF